MKNKKIYFSIVIILAFVSSFYINKLSETRKENHENHFEIEVGDEDITGLSEWMQKMLSDPQTGKLPENFRLSELSFSRNLPSVNAYNKTFGGTFQQRGPWNVGGRTRAIAIDKTNENVLLAGSTMGGFWRSTDGGSHWTKCIDSAETNNISCIAQDVRNGKTNTWYAGTGELYGSSLPGAFFSGNGIYKSTDNGLSWKRLAYTSSTPGGIYNSWSAVHNVVINPKIDSLDVVFVASFDGVWRSTNGGSNFTRRRGGIAGGYSYWTDVAVSPSGIVYAALSSGGGNAGIWRSTDNGGTWTNITPSYFTQSINRIVIGISPSDEKQIYFAAFTPDTGKISLNFEKTIERNSLWKYTYQGGDGSGAGGKWEDRSANIPTLGGAFGDFVSQQGYDISIKVKPDNANVVFLGGNNLYRSTDGFATSNNSTWIGGYGVNTTMPDFKTYPNHHPDNHGVIFYPSNSSKMISVHDGGISFTADNLATSVNWNSLNTGYLTTQFYTVAIDHNTNSKIVTGGLQDNGTYFTASDDQHASWKQPLSADGSFCFLSSASTEGYFSTQQGKIYRVILDANGDRTQLARIDPKGVRKTDYQFINPYIPDANNFKKIFVPAGYRIWRNNDVTIIPLHTQIDSTPVLTNWTELNNTKLTDTTEGITAIMSSKMQNDVLYYGTEKGKLFRLRYASTDTSYPVNVSGANFPSGGYINCIAQNPLDSNKLFVVFTNYGVLSIFYSTDGAATWNAISGNLEQNANGTGNGPSCRWITVAKVNDSLIYFVGTSTGLYATKALNGMQTVWTNQSPNEIGNNIVMMMDYRESDGMFAVATYGAGIFTTKIQSYHDGVAEKNILNDWVTLYPNPVINFLKIETQNLKSAKYEVMDLNGKIILNGTLTTPINTIDVADLKRGVYLVNILVDGKRICKRMVKE